MEESKLLALHAKLTSMAPKGRRGGLGMANGTFGRMHMKNLRKASMDSQDGSTSDPIDKKWQPCIKYNKSFIRFVAEGELNDLMTFESNVQTFSDSEDDESTDSTVENDHGTKGKKKKKKKKRKRKDDETELDEEAKLAKKAAKKAKKKAKKAKKKAKKKARKEAEKKRLEEKAREAAEQAAAAAAATQRWLEEQKEKDRNKEAKRARKAMKKAKKEEKRKKKEDAPLKFKVVIKDTVAAADGKSMKLKKLKKAVVKKFLAHSGETRTKLVLEAIFDLRVAATKGLQVEGTVVSLC